MCKNSLPYHSIPRRKILNTVNVNNFSYPREIEYLETITDPKHFYKIYFKNKNKKNFEIKTNEEKQYIRLSFENNKESFIRVFIIKFEHIKNINKNHLIKFYKQFNINESKNESRNKK